MQLKKLKYVLRWVENIVGKGENTGFQHFLLFPRFLMAFFLRSFKVRIVWQRVNLLKCVKTTDNIDLYRVIKIQICYISPWVNPLPNPKIFHWPNLRGSSDNTFALSKMTNYGLFQTESLQLTISNLMKMAESSPNALKTLWKKENYSI